MKKTILLLAILCISFSSKAETRSLLITETGTVSAMPDKLTIHLGLNSTHKHYNKTVAALNEKSNKLTKLLKEKAQINPEKIKTENYRIDRSFEYDRNLGKNQMTGFQARQSILIHVDNSKEILNNIIGAIANHLSDIDFSISYFNSTPNTYNRQALKLAIKNAKKKAKLIANESGVKLGQILNITYGTEINSTPPMYRMNRKSMVYSAESVPNLENFNAKKINFTKSVNINWEIK